ncbi:hypothetical protein J6590_026232 [Homalodisca vitripennis]|nr:hypothetical protein J6590_026232 [Homalodisca vitripennis]
MRKRRFSWCRSQRYRSCERVTFCKEFALSNHDQLQRDSRLFERVTFCKNFSAILPRVDSVCSPTPTVILHSRQDLVIHPSKPVSRHLQLVMSCSWTSIELSRHK